MFDVYDLASLYSSVGPQPPHPPSPVSAATTDIRHFLCWARAQDVDTRVDATLTAASAALERSLSTVGVSSLVREVTRLSYVYRCTLYSVLSPTAVPCTLTHTERESGPSQRTHSRPRVELWLLVL